jgi:hypothetical protein
MKLVDRGDSGDRRLCDDPEQVAIWSIWNGIGAALRVSRHLRDPALTLPMCTHKLCQFARCFPLVLPRGPAQDILQQRDGDLDHNVMFLFDLSARDSSIVRAER